MTNASDVMVRIDVVFLTLDTAVMVVAAMTLWRQRLRFSTYLALMFCGVAMECVCALAAVLFFSPDCGGLCWYIVLRMLGRVMEIAGGVCFLGYFYNYFNGRPGPDHREHDGAGIGEGKH